MVDGLLFLSDILTWNLSWNNVVHQTLSDVWSRDRHPTSSEASTIGALSARPHCLLLLVGAQLTIKSEKSLFFTPGRKEGDASVLAESLSQVDTERIFRIIQKV